MFGKTFSFAGPMLLAGAAVLVTPGSGQAQHHGGGHGGGFHSGGFHHNMDRRFFDPRFGRFGRDFDRRFFDPRFSPGFRPGLFLPF